MTAPTSTFTPTLPIAVIGAGLAGLSCAQALLQAGHPLDCQLSIGVASWQGPQDTLDAMLARADAALYQAKERGRNQTCVG